jgi:hypothetical protein
MGGLIDCIVNIKAKSIVLFEGFAFEGNMFLKASGFYCFTTKSVSGSKVVE